MSVSLSKRFTWSGPESVRETLIPKDMDINTHEKLCPLTYCTRNRIEMQRLT
jgi:hypothetical protein